MTSTKKRKLEEALAAKSISAFAARRKLQQPSQNLGSSSGLKGQLQNEADEQDLFDGNLFDPSSAEGVLVRSGQDQLGNNGNENGLDQDDEMSDSPYVEDEGVQIKTEAQSREVPHANKSRPVYGLTNWKPNISNVSRKKSGSLLIKLSAGERLVFLGEYGLSVITGQISVLGAIISASSTVYSVYALASHSLPVIRFLASEDNQAEIRIHQQSSGIRNLRQLSPIFGRLCHDGIGPQTSDSDISSLVDIPNSSFKLLFSSQDAPRGMVVNPVMSPPEWNEAISYTASGKSSHGKPSSTMICGPKSSGKSTFARLLTNRLLSVEGSSSKTISRSKKERSSRVAFLDIDPGQPEFSTPGHLSLVYLSHFNMGPPYSHPLAAGSHEVIRSHSIAALSPAADPALYMKCVQELLSHYRNILSTDPKCPLIINTPGWVLGTGLDILVDIIKASHPTEIIYMSQEGPAKVVTALKDASKSGQVLTLPSQVTEYTARTASHLRSMQALSYFHAGSTDKGQSSWNAEPLTAVPPWKVKYAGQTPGILGIMCVGEQPPPEMLIDTIDGTLLSIVVLDDLAAIMQPREQIEEGKQMAMVIGTPEGIPYFNPDLATSLDPSYSHVIGLALVRGIDIKRQRLQLLTPILMDEIKRVKEEGKLIVLLSGKLDTPGWAYTEDLYKKNFTAKSQKDKQTMQTSDDESEDGEDSGNYADRTMAGVDGTVFNEAPWIEKVRGDQGRGIGGRVWRVRRDLGKTGGGGG